MIQRSTARSKRSVHFNARLPKEVSDRLRSYAERRRISASAAAVELLDEALRMESFPGIDFRWTAIGRQPFVIGTGLTVWELYHVWIDHGRNVQRVRKNFPHLTPAQVSSAASYVQAFANEEPRGSWGTRPHFARVVQV